MAEDSAESNEKTEQPTDERRDEFRKRGDVVQSRELTSVATLVSAVSFLSFSSYYGFLNLREFFSRQFDLLKSFRLTQRNTIVYFDYVWVFFLKMVVPIFCLVSVVALFFTLGQTRMNISLEWVKPNFQKLTVLPGLKRMFSLKSFVELWKSIGKMFSIGFLLILLLYSERHKIPGLIHVDLADLSLYWMGFVKSLFWSACSFLLIFSGIDYVYNYFSLEKKMMMTKQELREDLKKREIDPHVKGKMRKLQRDISARKTIESTKEATVLITNPTHYSIAIKYELKMKAPILVAKGVDFLALQMRETAKQLDIPIVENRLLARTIYNTLKVREEIPEDLYAAMSEIIRYVFKIKGIKIQTT